MSKHAASTVDTPRLQDGIYYVPKDSPKASYRLLLLDIKPQTNPAEARIRTGKPIISV